MGANVPTGVSPSKSGSHGYQYILVVGAFSAFFFGMSIYPLQLFITSRRQLNDHSFTRLGNWL